ncbi:MAG: LysM peptidoglycan-binding domain-containing protein [Lachnospiraceae bacterium]|nr:LysM peptidoglycan-binding domain-containing protein [Lachnospiraceae bacterium]
MDNSERRYANNDWCYEQCRRGRCRGIYHMIRQGDTLYSLSRQYKVSVDAIMRANPGVNIYNLHINDELCIPVMMNNRPMPGRPMPRSEMSMNNNMPLDFTFDFAEEDMNMGRQREFSMFDDEMVETESHKQANYFSENDSVKDMLEKTGMTMAELLDCINRR